MNGRFFGAARWLAILFGSACLGSACLLAPSSASALELTIERPGEREFVRDLADMLTPEDEKLIRAECDKLLTEKAVPIIVVTIESMAKHGGEGLRIETFATLLFDQWQIGHAKLGDNVWNNGILLLVSKGDRKARIELGGGWGHREDQLCQKIMEEQIIPNFKAGQFSAGILAGVGALDKMARKLELPKATSPPMTQTQMLVWAGFGALAIFTVISLIRKGSGGWAWLMWAGVFGVIGMLLYQFMQNAGNSSSSSGGGFSGGSFGGGSSGGGGATGSW